MLMFLLGVLFGLVASIMFGVWFTKSMIKKGHYASAVYRESTDTWEIRGRYLQVAGRIHKRIKLGNGVKYIL